jgi:hypothetical protein
MTIHSMVARTGGQLYVADLARALAGRGTAIAVVAPDRPGEGVGAELVAAGVQVVGSVEDIGWEPEVVYGHTTAETVALALELHEVPVAFHCHGLAGPTVEPPMLRAVRRYACTGLHTSDLLVRHGVDPRRIDQVPNAVDLARFPMREPLPARPTRAALFGTCFQVEDVGPVADACERLGIELILIGGGLGAEHVDPSPALRSVDVVFASGRSALEAAATGCAVVIWNVAGSGGMLAPVGVDTALSVNLGVPLYARPSTAVEAVDALGAYDPEAASAVATHVRRERSLERTADLASAMLRSTVATRRLGEAADDRRWLASWCRAQGQASLAQASAIWVLERRLADARRAPG